MSLVAFNPNQKMRKKIDGKMYTAIAVSSNKKEAEQYMERARGDGHLARIVEMTNTIGGEAYYVYAVRKK